MPNAKRERIKSKNLIPNISASEPEKTTGTTDATVTKNQVLPKTLPRRSGGVDSCKNVCDGTSIPTKLKPSKSTDIKANITLTQLAVKTGIMKARTKIEIPVVRRAALIICFFLNCFFNNFGIINAPSIAPMPAGTKIKTPAELRGIYKIFLAIIGT
jgi:hypothetical protein